MKSLMVACCTILVLIVNMHMTYYNFPLNFTPDIFFQNYLLKDIQFQVYIELLRRMTEDPVPYLFVLSLASGYDGAIKE